jgi:PAS domain S-box-containing protein
MLKTGEGNGLIVAGFPAEPPAATERLLAAGLLAARDLYFLLDRDRRFRFASASGLEALGRTEGELLGRSWREAGLPPATMAPIEDALATVLATGEAADVGVELVTAAGPIALDCRLDPVRDAAGALMGAFLAARDVTERRRAEKAGAAAAERERRRLALILENVSEAIAAVFVDTGDIVRNRAWLDFHGYGSFVELGGWAVDDVAGLFEMWGPDGRELATAEKPLRRALRGESFRDLEIRLRRKDSGRAWWGSYNGGALRDEAGRVVAALISMRDSTLRHESEAALRASEARFRGAVTMAAVPIMLHAEDGEVLAVSEGLLEATGYRRDELKTFDRWLELAYRERAEERRRSIARRFREDLPIPGVEVQVHTCGGEVRTWVWHAPPPERLADGRKCLFAIGSDVTERKAAERRLEALVEERDMLLAELNHRVKNNLQLVTSLLKLQAMRSEEPAALRLVEQASQRIAAIAQVHASLYQGVESETPGRLEFGAYLRDLCSRLAASFLEGGAGHVTLEVETAPVRLRVDQAIPLGLVVNELVTNAFKHGFATGGPGRVQVRLAPLGEEGLWRLEVVDDGPRTGQGGAVPAGGLGMQLVEGFARQLRGQLTIERADTYRVALDFPA